MKAIGKALARLAETHKTGDTQVLTLRQKMALEEHGSMRRELSGIESESRRKTLIAQREAAQEGLVVYRFDIRLQGEGETVFFDV